MFEAPLAIPAQDPPAAGKKQRGRPRKAREPAGSAIATPQAPPKTRGPKPKAPTAPNGAEQPATITMMLLDLTVDEAVLVEQIAGALQRLPAERHGHVLAALGKVFGDNA
jgi:hypothetical protein